MHLIIGGAYQGKKTFAKEKYGFRNIHMFICMKDEIDFSYPCVANFEVFTYGCVERGEDPVEYFKLHRDEWEDAVLICRDISAGMVPVNATERKWRECHGKLCQYLSKEASQVSRIFCGLEQRLK